MHAGRRIIFWQCIFYNVHTSIFLHESCIKLQKVLGCPLCPVVYKDKNVVGFGAEGDHFIAYN